MKRLMSLCAAAFFWGCNSAAEPDPIPLPAAAAVNTDTASTQTPDDDVSFEDILAQYQALNQRLEDVSYNIQSANAALCPVTDRSMGFTVHTLYDYPENLQPYARGLLNVDENLSIRTVREHSAADLAGLHPADRLVRVNGTYLPSGRTAKTLYAALSKRAFQDKQVNLTLRPSGSQNPDQDQTLVTRTLEPETICGYPVHLFFSEQINGHTNGEEVWITSELMRSLPEDVDLALVVAHEMAHAIAGHMALPPEKLLELEADRMALIMLARAGYDIDRAVENWAWAPHPDDEAYPSATHPTQAERLEHFSAVQSDIQARKAEGRDLDFEN